MVGDNLPRNFSWLRVGKVAGCSCPQSENQLRALVNIGIKHLVTLSTDTPPPQCINAIQGLQWTTIAVKEFAGPTVSQMMKLIQICDKALNAKEPMAIHCRMGRGRTGTMLAAYLMNYELKSPTEAIEEVRGKRPGSVETRDQEKALDIWERYLEDQQSQKKTKYL